MYEIRSEEYLMPHGSQLIHFRHKIVRANGSLVFRTETLKYAQQILSNLFEAVSRGEIVA